MAHSLINLIVHVITSTKGRRRLIHDDIQPRLWAYMGGILRELKCIPLIVNGTEDHVHMLIKLAPESNVPEVLRLVKTNSSRWVHRTWPNHHDFAWQTGYAAFSVSQSKVEEVRAYIANQAEHHRRVSIDEELRSFLDRHGIAFDERHDWD